METFKTEYNLPVGIVKNQRTIDVFPVKQGGCICDYYYVVDKNNHALSAGPIVYIGVENLIKLNS